MSAQCEVKQRRASAPTTLSLLGTGLALLLGLNAGCNRVVVCKAEEMALLPQKQYCDTCKPLDHELLERLNTTELPWPVRQAVDDCAREIRKRDAGGFVTKQSLRDCTRRVSTLDEPTKAGLAELINKSNLAEEEDNRNFHAKCDVMLPGGAAPMPGAPMPPPSGMGPAPGTGEVLPPGMTPAPTGPAMAPPPGTAPALPPPSAMPAPAPMPSGPASAPALPPPPAPPANPDPLL